MNLPKILVLDIETSPIEAYVFGLKDQNIALNQVKKDWHIMCYSAKWFGKSEMFYEETRNGNDKKLLKKLWHLLDKADVLVTQNGARFDAPRIEARMRIKRILPPPSPFVHADTYLANKKTGFTSHKLEYLTDVLNDDYKKTLHSEFPGMSLWTECLNGNPKAWAAMKKYNGEDVLSTEELYKNTLPWASKSFPSPVIPMEAAPQCNTCHSYKLRSLGVRHIKPEGKYRRYICTQCGKCTNGDIYK